MKQITQVLILLSMLGSSALAEEKHVHSWVLDGLEQDSKICTYVENNVEKVGYKKRERNYYHCSTDRSHTKTDSRALGS
jgi:hypothetical protein